MISPLEILQQYWGYSSFRNPQDKIIDSVLANNNTVALLPTGGGKSICFQVPALAKDGICIVISPLIALMEDQVKNLTEKGIKALTLPSGASQDDLIILFDNLKFGKYKFLYISPERLQSSFIQQKIKELDVNLIAIDEAHCISEWGHDFRPSYRNIKILKELLPETNFIALTATATQKVIDDITTSLELENVQIFKKSFFRENLAYQIFTIEDKLFKLRQIFTKTKTPAIVYVNSRNKTKDISNYLNANGFKSSFYHGGLASSEKKEAFTNWMNEKTPIMVATNAFGMGIDKANVGVVIHIDLPNSVENYVQEAGRAGRNGKKSFSVVLQNPTDIQLFKEKSIASTPTLDEIKEIHRKLYQHFQIANGELIETSFELPISEFSKKYNFTLNKVNSTLTILINNGIISLESNFDKKSNILFLFNSSQTIKYINNQEGVGKFIKVLLRNYGGVFEQNTKIDEFRLAEKAGITSHLVIQYLTKMSDDGVIEYQKHHSNATLYFLVPREDDRTINPISKQIVSYLSQKKIKGELLVEFIQTDTICRSQQILHYFNEPKTTVCGMCDVCLTTKKKATINIKSSLVSLLEQEKELSSKEISLLINADDKDILVNLQQLLSEEKIAINSYNKYHLI